MYCASCHGLPLHQLYPVASYGFRCHSLEIGKSEFPLLAFAKNINCDYCKLKLKLVFTYIKRYRDACWSHQALPDCSCVKSLYEEECTAYSRMTLNQRSRPYNNEACKTCDNNGKADASKPHHCKCLKAVINRKLIGLFDFRGITLSSVHIRKEYYRHGQSGNPCLVKHCQVGFQAHDDRCISDMTADMCYPPQQNRHSSDFLIANRFRPALVIHYKYIRFEKSQYSRHLQKQLKETKPCTDLPALYHSMFLHDSANLIQCAVLYFDPGGFAKLYRDIYAQDISITIFSDI